MRKIRIPYNPEAGFGSMNWDGEVNLNEKLVRQLQFSAEAIESAIREVKGELEQRMEKFRGEALLIAKRQGCFNCGRWAGFGLHNAFCRGVCL